MSSDGNDTMGRPTERTDRTDRIERIDRSTERTGRSSQPLDDSQLGSLIRDVASGWQLPPVRLDQPGWRDRVRSPRSRRADRLSGWLGRLGRAATAAIALTVVAALVAVYLTRPPQPTGKAPASGSAAPSRSTPRASAVPTPTPLPKLFVAGAAPSPGQFVVQTQSASFAEVDLSTGTIGTSLAEPDYGSQVRTRPNGDVVCVCFVTFQPGSANTEIAISLRRWDANLRPAGTASIADIHGSPDPRDPQGTASEGNVSATTTFSTDGVFAYVGWSARVHPAWTSGILVVRLDTGEVVQRLELPQVSDGTGATRAYINAPRVIGRLTDGVVIDRDGYDSSPLDASNPVFAQFNDLFTARTSGDGSLKTPVAVRSQPCDAISLAGGLDGGGLWLACIRYSAANEIRRIAADGSLTGATSVDVGAIEGTTSVLSADGSAIYLWNPVSLVLTKVDTQTGVKTTARAAAATAATSEGPLTALGRWLAPSVAAKMFLSPGIALSPDGTRVYAIGITGGSPSGSDEGGSSGVVVFDTASMQSIATWPATADYVSIALNEDGSSVFLAGMPGVRADGSQDRRQGASLTVLDATNGSVQLIAGDLGGEMLTFAEPILRSR